MGRVIAIVLLAWVSACASTSGPVAVAPPADLSCEGAGADTYYFPAGILDIEGAADPSDAFVRHWYSAHLAAMNEPSLSCGANASEAYRFLWLRSFHQPIAVRVSRTGQHFELVATVLSGHAGYEPGHIAQRVRRELTEEEWTLVMRALERTSFWEMSANPPTEEIGVDGAQWIIEGSSGRYHVVDRWGGDDGVAAVGSVLLDLSDIRVRGPVY